MFALYVANFLDRVNVSFAALQMNRDLGFSSAGALLAFALLMLAGAALALALRRAPALRAPSPAR